MIGLLAIACLHLSGFETPISMEAKDTLLPVLLKTISAEAGVDATAPKNFANTKLTILVSKMPARELLDHIASVCSFDTVVSSNQYRMEFGREKRLKFDDYMAAELRVRMRPVRARLDALANLTVYPFGQAPKIDAKRDTPMAWAAERIGQSGYYAAGLWHRVTLAKGVLNSYARWADTFAYATPVNLFWVGQPREQNIGWPFPIAAIDEGSAAIAGTVIVVAAYATTGELRVVALDGDAEPEPVAQRPFLYAHPPEELRATPFAKELAQWETPIHDIPLNIRQSPCVRAGAPENPDYFCRRISLTEKLIDLHRKTGIPVIATSFRVPALDQTYSKGKSAEELLTDLSKTEQPFLRYEGGALMVRHPAYWLLLCSEPTESVMLKAEEIAKQRPLTVAEYGAVAFQMSSVADDEPPWRHVAPPAGAVRQVTERLVEDRGLLMRFDPQPLVKAYPALCVIGSMSDQEREALFAGKGLDAVTDSFGVTAPGRLIPGTYTKVKIGTREFVGATTPTVVTPPHTEVRRTIDQRPNQAAEQAPLFGAEVDLRYVTVAEEFGLPYLFPRGHPNLKSRIVWMDSAGDTYHVYFGFSDGPVATYTFTIRANL